MAKGDHLFARFDSFSAVEHYKKALKEELRVLPEAKLKGTNIDDWIKFYVDKFRVNIPKLSRDAIEGDMTDVQLNARHFRDRFYFDDREAFIPTPGTQIKFTVPYEGDEAAFECSGNKIYASFPSAEVRSNALVFTCQMIDHDADKINNNFDKDLNAVEGHLRDLEGNFREFNDSIEATVRQMLEERLEKFKKDHELASKLKYPL